MDSKTKAIVAHIFFIGWIISFILNLNDKDGYTSFYLRQTLLLHALMLVGWVPVFGWLLWVTALIGIIVSLVYALQGEEKEIPYVGSYFQKWFRAF